VGYFALGTPHSLDAVRDRRPAARTATLTNQRRRWESPECECVPRRPLNITRSQYR